MKKKARRSRIISISLKIDTPDYLINEVKTVNVSIYNHPVRCLVRSPGLKFFKSISLNGDEHCCFLLLKAPVDEQCFLHASVYITDPIPLLVPGAAHQSRFLGYIVQDIGPGDDDLFLTLHFKEFERYTLYKPSVSF